MELFIVINSFFLLLALAINSGLALFIYFNNSQEEANRFFSYILAVASFWVFGLLLYINLDSAEWLLFLRRLTPIAGALIGSCLLYFSLIFPKGSHKPSFLWKSLILGPGLFFPFLSALTPWIIKGFVVVDTKYLFLGRPLLGPGYFIYLVYFLACFLLAIGILLRKYFIVKGKSKGQVFYLLLGLGISGTFGIISGALLPLMGYPLNFSMGPTFTLIAAFFASYAIVQFKFLNIEDFLISGVLFLFGTSAVVGTFGLMFLNRLSFLFSFYVILANFLLGVLVLIKNSKDKINISFFGVTLAIVLWTIGVYIFWNSASLNIATWGGKLAFLGAAAIPAFLLLFGLAFPKELKPISFLRWLLIFLPPALFSVLIFSNQVLKEVVSLGGGISRIYGPAYPLFSIYYLLYLGLFFYYLYVKQRVLGGINRIQIRYVFLGWGGAAAIALTTNLILPLLGIGAFSFIGPHATLIAMGCIAYAILKHRLMSIELVVQRSVVYAVATILIMAIYALAVIISETFLRRIMGYSSLLVAAGAALLIAIVYQPLIHSFQGITDRLFFRGRYDYQKTLREISQQIASVIKLEELTRLIVTSFIDTMKVSEISFLLLDKQGAYFKSVPISLARYKRIEIDRGSPIVSWLSSVKDILVREEVEDEIERQTTFDKETLIRLRSLEEVRDEMERLGISIWVPIVSKDELIGIIALGHKLSGDLFTSEDIRLLGTLANQTAVALDNARLYDEVVNMKDYSEEILQSMVNGVMTVDIRGRIVTYNVMAERITGRRVAEVLGQSCQALWGPKGEITKVVENTLKDRCYVNFESSIASPERGLVPVSFSSTILRDHQGKRIGVLLTIQDLTEIKELEGKVRQADKLTALATMAAGMAHEIKNPLSSMKVLSQLMPIKFADAEFRDKLQEIMPREINRIDRIVESLLGFARATAPNFQETDINEILKENLHYFEHQAGEAEVEIVTAYADLPKIELDHGQISQVFSNLILNAIQAMPDGGQLKVETGPGKVIDGTLQNVKIKVSDTGHGISEEKLKKLFDPFFTTKYGGTGLGLTISHSIVDGHKGYFDVESKVGQGTTFTVSLPVTQGLI
ncbi:MAG: PAS domain S-box protein [Candidatus Margulisbacteria bacterium]|nr:PAS domain S-box protein [Candidatus Margulisiibacteriota bacterium]